MQLLYYNVLVFFGVFVKIGVRSNLHNEEAPIVHINQGVLKGIKETSLNGKDFYSYKSIPFAKPPVGELRFKNPVALESWKGTLNATKSLEYCLQYPLTEITKEDKFSAVQAGSEDCLYLSVFTPKPSDITAKLPVMVYIHGGGFFFGGGRENPPHVFMNQEIVLVLIQYRLGVLGFLSTEDAVLPGNMGLRDQQMALKWVQDNILHFGGDSSKVTLFGESAGAASSHMHMLSPGSKGLFQRAICQSGTAICPWAFVEDHRKFAKEMGDVFQCDLEKGTESYLSCMQKIPAEYLLQFMAKSLTWGFSQLFVVPRVDGDVIPDKPEILLKEGKYNKVDFISGINRDEGALLYAMASVNPEMIESLNSNFSLIGPVSLNLLNERNPEEVATKIYRHYLKRDNIHIDPKKDADNLVKLFSDRYNNVCHDISSIFHSCDSEMSVYLYQLDHKGKLSMTDLFLGPGGPWVGHMDDLIYQFSGGQLFFRPLEDENDLKLRNIILSMWTNFARTGNPTPSGSDFTWEKASNCHFKYLSLLPNPTMKEEDIRAEIRKFWLSLDLKQMKNLHPEKRLTRFQKEELPPPTVERTCKNKYSKTCIIQRVVQNLLKLRDVLNSIARNLANSMSYSRSRNFN